MGRRRALSALTFITILLGMASLNGVLLALAIPPLVFIFSGLLSGPRRPQVEIYRRLSHDRVSVGATVEVELVVSNSGPKLEELHLSGLAHSRVQLIEGDIRRVIRLGQGESRRMSYRFRSRRGGYIFPPIEITNRDSFNLWSRSVRRAAPARLVVLPRAEPLKRVAIRPVRTHGYSGQIPARLGGAGVNFFGLRNYEPGDPMNWIDWRTSARYDNQLFTKLYEQERVADVSLVVDARERSNVRAEGESLLDHSVLAAAALAEALLAGGNRVGLLVYGGILDWTYPRYGKIQNERILQRLARAAPGRSPAFDKIENLPTRIFPANSQVILVSPLLNEDADMLRSIPALDLALLVVSPDPVDYAARSLPSSEYLEPAMRLARLERALSLRSLRQAGVQVVEWKVGVPFKQLAHSQLSRPPTWLRSIGVQT